MQQEITQELVQSWLPRRQADSNKGSYGSVLAAAGSLAYRGAAALCAEGALRGGAGLVYLASVEPVVQMVLARTPECCACGCRTAAGGGIHPQDAAALRSWFSEKHAVLLAGPGLGEGAGEVCRALLGKNPPWAGVVLDADALNALAAGRLRDPLPENTILTPHPGEAARLLGCTVADVQADREQAVLRLAETVHPRRAAQRPADPGRFPRRRGWSWPVHWGRRPSPAQSRQPAGMPRPLCRSAIKFYRCHVQKSMDARPTRPCRST